MVAARRDLPTLRNPARFEAWSYRLLVRACYAEGRKERRWAPNLRLLEADEPPATDELGAVIDRDQLESAFRRLSMDHRVAVVLRYYLDLPVHRIADLLGLPIGTVHSRPHYAMRGLRAAIEADGQLAPREAARSAPNATWSASSGRGCRPMSTNRRTGSSTPRFGRLTRPHSAALRRGGFRS